MCKTKTRGFAHLLRRSSAAKQQDATLFTSGLIAGEAVTHTLVPSLLVGHYALTTLII